MAENANENPWLFWAQNQEAQEVTGTLNEGAKEYRNIWIYAETRGGFIAPEVRQVFYKARELADWIGTRLQAVLLGDGVERLAQDLIAYGADTVVLAEHPLLADFSAEAHAKTLFQLAEKYKPEILLFGGSRVAEQLAPRVCAKLGAGYIPDGVDLELDDLERLLQVTRSMFGGRVNTTSIYPERKPQVATVRPRIYREADFDRLRRGEVARVEVALGEGDRPTRLVETRAAEAIDLEGARVIVCGGKGIGSKEGFAKLAELADMLGGQLAGTRSAAAAGWIDADRQIGMGGKKVRPQLYVGVGVSGSFDHQAGMGQARTVVALNQDRDAPLMELADFALVGDWQTTIDAWIAELRERSGRSALVGKA